MTDFVTVDGKRYPNWATVPVVDFDVGGVKLRSRQPQRDTDIITRREAGERLSAIAKAWKISTTRASQVHRNFCFKRGDPIEIERRSRLRRCRAWTDVSPEVR